MGLLVERRPMKGGKSPQGFGLGEGRPRWAKWGPPRAGGCPWPNQACGIVPHCLAGKLAPPGSLYIEGHPWPFNSPVNSLISPRSRDSLCRSCAEEDEGISSTIARCRAAGVLVQVFRCSSWTRASEAVVSTVCV